MSSRRPALQRHRRRPRLARARQERRWQNRGPTNATIDHGKRSYAVSTPEHPNELVLLGGPSFETAHRYSLRGSIELTQLGRTGDGGWILNRATLRAELRDGGKIDSPAVLDFFAASQVIRADHPFCEMSFEVLYPELLAVRGHATKPAPGHLRAPIAVRGTASLALAFTRQRRGVAVTGTAFVHLPPFSTVAVPLYFSFFCFCPKAENPKCKTLCLSIKVGADAQDVPILSTAQVERIVREVNKIWGCAAPGQCCIQFEARSILVPRNPRLKETVKVTATAITDDFRKMANIERDPNYYNLYFVKCLQTVGGGNVNVLGLTSFDDTASAVVQVNGYPETTIGQLTAHELGHALGLSRTAGTEAAGLDRHSAHADNLMEPNASIPAIKLNAAQCERARNSPLLSDSEEECSQRPAEGY